MTQLLVVRLDGQRYALRLQDVERVLRMVEITALPASPAAILGLINVQGRVLSVVDLRAWLHLPAREATPEDVLVIVGTAAGRVALATDGVEGVSDWPEQASILAEQIYPAPAQLEAVLKLSDGLLLICDLDRLLALGQAAIPGNWPAGTAGGEFAAGRGQEGDDDAP